MAMPNERDPANEPPKIEMGRCLFTLTATDAEIWAPMLAGLKRPNPTKAKRVPPPAEPDTIHDAVAEERLRRKKSKRMKALWRSGSRTVDRMWDGRSRRRH